jgi:hypothetical protein
MSAVDWDEKLRDRMARLNRLFLLQAAPPILAVEAWLIIVAAFEGDTVKALDCVMRQYLPEINKEKQH